MSCAVEGGAADAQRAAWEAVTPPEGGRMLDRVLVLSASAGAGHVRAAQAIERALAAAGAAREVRHVHALDHTTKLFRRLHQQAYLDLVNHAPEVLGWLYDYLDRPWRRQRRRLALDKLNTRRFVRLLETYQPEWTIRTHFLPAEIIGWLRTKTRLACRHAIVVTDFDVHAMWLTREVDRYFVALEETRVHLDHLLEEGVAIRCNNLPVLAYKIDRLLDDPARLAAMQGNVRRLARPRAARDVVATLLRAGGADARP